jgi:hypothetical protein
MVKNVGMSSTSLRRAFIEVSGYLHDLAFPTVIRIS